mmetsp:Transcript_5342/g.13018  ORF Transcript_5342/g.13018 Transcript_5342/m.13018 type:complete len:107 (-) Transcript_5342:347-667(-)|eukprot:CAMPEP_0114513358 /NCGR_PEP_ID=MMETSP0109-20121206/15516_1 /TAXON_ID=29199 /ORGANISM="Chlorarachnion reptans, Strain CCCM449" /LENGTH=106 /DNA_ID=CAMNT_0001693203 /DNA_START=37 /DNA_END=357 /DNA_ORIENTATION=+
MADADSKADKAAKREADQLAEVDKYVEEAKVDVGKAEQALSSIKDDFAKELEATKKRERELAKVKVSKENVEFLQKEMELSHDEAERVLKIHKDDVHAAVHKLLAS